jgi:hypothetical protein
MRWFISAPAALNASTGTESRLNKLLLRKRKSGGYGVFLYAVTTHKKKVP